MKKEAKTNPKKMRGKIVSTAMTETIVVEVARLVTHPLYRKKRLISKKYKVHCPDKGDYNVGDIVNFQETSPLSKTKKWIFIKESK